MDDFANCFASKVSTDVDTVKKLGEDEWKKVADWWHSLSDIDKAVILAIAGYGGGKIAALLGATVGDVIAGGLIAFAGGMAWESLFNAAIECESKL